jgi:hypothetical protein
MSITSCLVIDDNLKTVLPSIGELFCCEIKRKKGMIMNKLASPLNKNDSMINLDDIGEKEAMAAITRRLNEPFTQKVEQLNLLALSLFPDVKAPYSVNLMKPEIIYDGISDEQNAMVVRGLMI